MVFRLIPPAVIFSLSLSIALPCAAQSARVVGHAGVEVSRAEFQAILNTSPSTYRAAAANDLGDRYEFITNVLYTRKLAASVDTLAPEDSGYWTLHFAILAAKAEFALRRLMDDVELADPAELAAEYYLTKKEQYAAVPEQRASSHILLASPPGLDRTEVRALGQSIRQQLLDGADWSSLVAEHSDDPGSAQRDGSLDRWISLGDPNITPPYSAALFEIEDIGGYVVGESQFGVHIIRLDGIEPKYYREFADVSAQIVQDIRAEQRKLALDEIRSRFHIDENAFIDGDAMEELFAPYKTAAISESD